MSESRPPLSRQQRRAMQRKLRKAGKGQTALTLGAAALAAVPAAQAATFTVTNLNDNGAGSLRQAIIDANGAAGADAIQFQAGLTGTITLTTGQLWIYDSVDIQGPGASVLTVSGNNASRVFYLYVSATTIDVTISGLTITGGNANIGGGVVDFDENLVLDSVVITGNTTSGDGAGVWADGFNMTLTIQSSTISGNTSGDDGGGMYVEDTGGPLTIQNTVVTGNDAADKGGGIYFYDPDNDVTIVDSTISDNSAGGVGGGVYLYSPDDGLFTISRTTISGNDAQAGGGVFLYSPDHGGAIENSTISGNQATAGDGGGIYLYNLYNFEIRHTTIAGNSASGTGGGIFSNNSELPLSHVIAGDNTAGTDNDLGNGAEGAFLTEFSLIESPGSANITDNGGNIFSQDPQLGALANHGGPTQTHLPAITSPVVDAGDPAFVPPPSTDQRGFARVVNGRIDMGAVEVAPGTVQLTASAASVAENAGTVTITATRTGGSDGAVSVTLDTADGSALAPGDYTAVAGSVLSWADGDSAPKSLDVTIVNDALDEPDETFTATLSKPTGGAVLGTPASETITIQDDDVPAPGTIQLTFSTANVAENAGTVTVTATRTGGSNGAVSVTLDTANGTALAPGDYTAVAGAILSWADGDTAPKSINITIVNDSLDEPDETFTATISNATGGATLGGTVTATITIQDDDLPASVVDVPTVGDVGRVLFTALLSLSGLFLLRRRRGLAAPVLLLTLLSAEANAAAVREAKAVTLSQITTRAQVASIRLSDGSSLQVPLNAIEVADRRSPKNRKHTAMTSTQSLAPGQPLLIKVRRNPDGSVKKVKLQVFDTLERAQAALQTDAKK
jgi:hypothetical protein